MKATAPPPQLPRIEEEPFVEAETAPASEATTFRCPLCGTRFSHGKLVCGACPLNRGCTLVSCPNCSYSFPRESRILAWWRRLRRPNGGSV